MPVVGTGIERVYFDLQDVGCCLHPFLFQLETEACAATSWKLAGARGEGCFILYIKTG